MFNFLKRKVGIYATVEQPEYDLLVFINGCVPFRAVCGSNHSSQCNGFSNGKSKIMLLHSAD